VVVFHKEIFLKLEMSFLILVVLFIKKQLVKANIMALLWIGTLTVGKERLLMQHD